MSDLSIVVLSLVTSLLSSGVVWYVASDEVEREANRLKLTGFELVDWLKRRNV